MFHLHLMLDFSSPTYPPSFVNGSLLFSAVSISVGAPLLGVMLILAMGSKAPRRAGYLATACMAVSFTASVVAFTGIVQTQTALYIWEYDWVKVSSTLQLRVGFLLDAASALMLLLVSLVALLVHVFSIGYMQEDANRARYFGLLQLFTFSMLGLVASCNLIQLFVFWELVGVCSYMLIGFWHTRPLAAAAATKAFVVNRIGDAGLLAGILLLMAYGVTPRFTEWQPYAPYFLGEGWLPTTAGLLIFLGCVGKSAQFPLFVWLPNAMEGPTPVSSLIHAATMVAAGVFLLLRIHPLLSPDALIVVACVGAVTACMGAAAALTQWDVKQVLAYSTISQLGYMVMAMGLAAPAQGFFHLVTHAFFKCGLFLVAATVIHVLHHAWRARPDLADAQDLRNMGGLGKRMPWLMFAYCILAAGLVGLPFTSGGLSKDAILATAYAGIGNSSLHTLVALLAFGTAALTAYYVARHGLLMFAGKPRIANDSVDSLPAVLGIPVGVLAACTLWFAFDINPIGHGWVVPFTATSNLLGTAQHWQPLLLAWGLISLGLFVAVWHYRYTTFGMEARHQPFWVRISFYAGYVDLFYNTLLVPTLKRVGVLFSFIDKSLLDGVIHVLARGVAGRAGGDAVSLASAAASADQFLIDGAVRLAGFSTLLGGRFAQGLQTGRLQTYLLFTLGAALAAVLYLVF